MSSVSKPRVRHNRHKQGLNLTLEKLSADFRKIIFCYINHDDDDMKMLPLITEVGGCLVCRFEVLQITIPIGSRTTAINQEIGTADETATGGHQELC